MSRRRASCCVPRREQPALAIQGGREEGSGLTRTTAVSRRDGPRWRCAEQGNGPRAAVQIGPAARSFAADAHGCIMVRAARGPPDTRSRREASRPRASSPRFVPLGSNRKKGLRCGTGPDLAEAGAVLAPLNTAARRLRRWPAASVDRRCARRSLVLRPGRRNGSQPNQETSPRPWRFGSSDLRSSADRSILTPPIQGPCAGGARHRAWSPSSPLRSSPACQ